MTQAALRPDIDERGKHRASARGSRVKEQRLAAAGPAQGNLKLASRPGDLDTLSHVADHNRPPEPYQAGLGKRDSSLALNRAG
jgi:hypothetical protein